MPLSRIEPRSTLADTVPGGEAIRARSVALLKQNQMSGSASTAQNAANQTNADRQPKSSIRKYVSRGVIIEARLPPHSITASAKPRPAVNTLVTAAVHTDGWISTIASAIGSHSARQVPISLVAKPSKAVARQTAITAAIPSRRGPKRSTNSPVNGAQITPATAAMLWPDITCARLQPNSFCSGSMNRPPE